MTPPMARPSCSEHCFATERSNPRVGVFGKSTPRDGTFFRYDFPMTTRATSQIRQIRGIRQRRSGSISIQCDYDRFTTLSIA